MPKSNNDLLKMMPNVYIEEFKKRLEHYINVCDIALSHDFDAMDANMYLQNIMEKHNFPT